MTTTRVGWITTPRACTLAGRDDQRCSGNGRYRVQVRGPLVTVDAHWCANHLAKNTQSLGIDPGAIGPWEAET